MSKLETCLPTFSTQLKMSSSQKRKATSSLEPKSKKKQQIELIRLQHISSKLQPVVATTPGASFPSNVKFTPYSKRDSNGKSSLHLHSSDHPTIDYTATEGAEPDDQLKHYIAVYDPATSSMKVTEATSLTIRGSIRPQPKVEDSDGDNADPIQGTRSALTQAFGSKKSKKAVAAMFENRQLGQGLEGQTIAEAIAATIGEDDVELEDAAVQAAARSAKPLPIPNLTTDDIEQVYSVTSLVEPKPGATTLKTLPLDGWRARLQAGKEIAGLRSRFVANRISYIGRQLVNATEEGQVQRCLEYLQLLRYIATMIEIHQFTVRQDSRRRMPWVDTWPDGTLTGSLSPGTIKQIVNHFFPENTANDRAMTLLRSTILALTLHIPPPSGRWGTNQLGAEPTDIQLDLAMKGDEVKKLYHELGCKVAPVSEAQLKSWKLERLAKSKKDENGVKIPKPFFALLKFPLEFPKISGRKGARN